MEDDVDFSEGFDVGMQNLERFLAAKTGVVPAFGYDIVYLGFHFLSELTHLKPAGYKGVIRAEGVSAFHAYVVSKAYRESAVAEEKRKADAGRVSRCIGPSLDLQVARIPDTRAFALWPMVRRKSASSTAHLKAPTFALLAVYDFMLHISEQ